MSKKQSNSTPEEEQSQGEDFKLVRGIGPSTEARLHSNGIVTYMQLASLSPADIAALISKFTGITAERIIKQDWLGQARALAANSNATELEATEKDEVNQVEEPVPVKDSSQVSFIVELRLDEVRQVLQTHAHYVQGQKETTWTGWKPEELTAFVQEVADLALPVSQRSDETTQSHLTIQEVADVVMPLDRQTETTAKPEPELTAILPVKTEVVLQARSMELLVDQANNPTQVFQATQPCQLHLTLNLDDSKLLPGTPIEYVLNVQAKAKGTNIRLPVCENQGSFQSAQQVQLEAKGQTLPPGFYHLEGVITFRLPPQFGKAAPVKARSSLVQFY